MKNKITFLLGLAAILGASQQADAAGFAIQEQSVSSMGNAYAGGAAIAEDATTIFFNPAGITRLCGTEVIAGIHGVMPVADFHDKGSIIYPGVLAGTVPPTNTPPINLTGNNGHDGGEKAIVGNFYASRQINDNFYVGLGILSPFGLVTDYDHHWKGRYHALRSQLFTVEINPVVAYKLNRCWSLGGGIRAIYSHAKLSNKVDYGTIAWDETTIETGLNTLEFLPQTQDGTAILKGNDWGWGCNLGILYEPCCGTRFGFNWRSQVMLHIKGDVRFKDLPSLIQDPALAGSLQLFFEAIKAAAATNAHAKADLILPDIFQISAYHELNSCWAIMADFTWTRWKLLKQLRVRLNAPASDNITTLNWENTMRYAFGVTYSPNWRWKIRTGIAYDETPIKNALYRTPRIPGNDRFWTTLGLGYNWNRCLHFDFAYAHIFVRDPKINKTSFALEEDYVRGGLKGNYRANADVVSAQAVWKF